MYQVYFFIHFAALVSLLLMVLASAKEKSNITNVYNVLVGEGILSISILLGIKGKPVLLVWQIEKIESQCNVKRLIS